MTRFALLFVLLASVGCKEVATPPPDDGTGLGERFESGQLVIVNDAGDRLDFDVYLAVTPEQRNRGLMFVRKMPERTGMLFVYDRPALLSIWMKNTYIPLDIIFIREDGTISSIDYNATPLTTNSRPAKEPVKYVIELNAGSAIRFNIGTSSRIIWGGDDALRE